MSQRVALVGSANEGILGERERERELKTARARGSGSEEKASIIFQSEEVSITAANVVIMQHDAHQIIPTHAKWQSYRISPLLFPRILRFYTKGNVKNASNCSNWNKKYYVWVSSTAHST